MNNNAIIYQVYTEEQCTGKYVASTKRVVTWKYGTSAANCSATGTTGACCRGKEHKVTLELSVASGKRRVLIDDQEIFFAVGSRTEGQFHLAWSHDGNEFSVVSHTLPPSTHEKVKFNLKRDELTVNGISFYVLHNIYELGTEAAAQKNLIEADYRTDYESTRQSQHDSRNENNGSTSNGQTYFDINGIDTNYLLVEHKLKKWRSLRNVVKKPLRLLSSKVAHAQME